MTPVPNTFSTFNFYIDRAAPMLTDTEFRVLMFAVRHIMGWQDKVNKRESVISLSMFQNGFVTAKSVRFSGTGLGRQTIIDALHSLCEFGFLTADGKATSDGQQWKLNEAEIKWTELEKRQAERDEKRRGQTNKARIKRSQSLSGGQSNNTSIVEQTSGGQSNNTSTGQSNNTESNPSSNPSSKPTHAPSGAAAVKAEKPNTKSKNKRTSTKSLSRWTLEDCAAFEEGCSAALAALRKAFGHNVDMSTFASMTVDEQRVYIRVHKELERVGVASTDYAALVKFARGKWADMPVSQLTRYVTDWRQAMQHKEKKDAARNELGQSAPPQVPILMLDYDAPGDNPPGAREVAS